jgi:hypothetical protein
LSSRALEIDAAWQLVFGRRRRGRHRWTDRLAIRPEQILHVIPRLAWRGGSGRLGINDIAGGSLLLQERISCKS